VNKTMVIGLSILLVLYLAFGLLLGGAKAGCDEPIEPLEMTDDCQSVDESVRDGCLDHAEAVEWERIQSTEPTFAQIEAQGDCDAEEQDYDKEHRKLLGLPPGECVKAFDDYPTRAAGWLAAIEAQQRGCVTSQYGSICQGDPPPKE
jgi:hypothetical protein